MTEFIPGHDFPSGPLSYFLSKVTVEVLNRQVEVSFKKTRIAVKQVRNTFVPRQIKKQQPLGDATNKNYFQPGYFSPSFWPL